MPLSHIPPTDSPQALAYDLITEHLDETSCISKQNNENLLAAISDVRTRINVGAS